MSSNKKILIVLIMIAAVVGGMIIYRMAPAQQKDEIIEEIQPTVGDIRKSVSTTGVVEPQNRLEVKPSISGRLEEILVKEGVQVKKGDVLAWMSSTERAALVDVSGFQGEQARQYWEDVYKKTPIVSPIDGQVIVRSFEPGQTVTTSDAIIVLSDRLIVSAQFDETDIGRVKVGQRATIVLDAYPDNPIQGIVDHIAYESTLVNNVTIYDVDIVPQEIPDFFRSGMSANVEAVEDERKGVLLIPLEAIIEEGNQVFTTIKKASGKGAQRAEIKIGMKGEDSVEVVSGLSGSDRVIVKTTSFSLKKNGSTGTNPFMPSRKTKK